MISITEQQIFDFIKCPLRYDAQYNHRMVLENHPSLNSLLSSPTNAFLINLMNGKVLTEAELKRKWDSVCMKHQDVMTQRKCLEGIDCLMKLYKWAANEKLRVGDIRSPYIVMLDKGNIEVHGEMDAIVVNSKNQIELLELDYSQRYPDQAILDMKLHYSLEWLAFKSLYGKELQGIHIHHIKSNKDWYTFRSPEDITRLERSVINIVHSIQQHIFYPRESVMCSSCDMKNYCRAWRG